MSKKKNYRAMYNKQTDSAIPEVSSIDTVEPKGELFDDIPEEVAEVFGPIEVVEEPECEFVTGTVVGCSRLNVRKSPETTAEVICIVPVWSEVQVCVTHKDDFWFHVYTAAGQEGYCMKQFIEI